MYNRIECYDILMVTIIVEDNGLINENYSNLIKRLIKTIFFKKRGYFLGLMK